MPEGIEEFWKRSVRAYDASNQTDRAQEWYRYHKAQIHMHRVLSDALVARHEKTRRPASRGPWAPMTIHRRRRRCLNG
jgi:hypothetical protein